MAEDEISAEASAKGGKLTAKGDGAARITNSVADLMSPFSEIGGAIGEHIRVWRDYSLAKTTARARELASQNGIDLKPVHPKALIPWAEGASREDDEAIQEKWARLLLNSMGDYNASSVWASNILGEIGSKEAALLEALGQKKALDEHMSNSEVSNHITEVSARTLYPMFSLSAEYELASVLENTIKILTQAKSGFLEKRDQIKSAIQRKNDDSRAGVLIRRLLVKRAKSYEVQVTTAMRKFEKADPSLDLEAERLLLESLVGDLNFCESSMHSSMDYLNSKGLTEACTTEWTKINAPDIEAIRLEGIRLTPLGYDFLSKLEI